jgi:hypothetical protein
MNLALVLFLAVGSVDPTVLEEQGRSHLYNLEGAEARRIFPELDRRVFETMLASQAEGLPHYDRIETSMLRLKLAKSYLFAKNFARASTELHRYRTTSRPGSSCAGVWHPTPSAGGRQQCGITAALSLSTSTSRPTRSPDATFKKPIVERIYIDGAGG